MKAFSFRTFFVATTLMLTAALVSQAAADGTLPRRTAPDGAEVYIISPKDGETVGKTFVVLFGLKGMGVAPAGIDMPNTGHHHLLIDLAELPDLNLPLPMSENLVHFGGGQTETKITLEPGTHTLQLVLGDHLHIPFTNPVISKKITVTVK